MAGWLIDPDALIDRFGADAVRYFFLREGRFGQDWNYTDAAFVARYTADLADDLGNLLHRTTHMIRRYCGGMVSASGEYQAIDRALRTQVEVLPGRIDATLAQFAFHDALAAIWEVVGAANRYVEENAPWLLAGQRRAGDRDAAARLDTVLYTLADTLLAIACAVAPFMPATAGQITLRLGQAGEVLASPPPAGVCRPGTPVTVGEPLFPKNLETVL